MTTKDAKAFVARYIAVDSHLNERNGSTKQVYGVAGERPAGRKLADDIARYCNQLDREGYEVISIFPAHRWTRCGSVRRSHGARGRANLPDQLVRGG